MDIGNTVQLGEQRQASRRWLGGPPTATQAPVPGTSARLVLVRVREAEGHGNAIALAGMQNHGLRA